MPFTINDLQDLTRLLIERPEWLSEVRRIVLTDSLLRLPEIVRDLAEAQRRTEERLEQLAEAQRRTEERLEQLAEAQRRTEERLEQLAEAQRRTEERLEQLAEAQRRTEERVQKLENQMADVRGSLLEMDYRNKVTAFFGGWLRKPRLVDLADMWDLLEDSLSREEMDAVRRLDLLVRGQLPRQRGDGDVYLAVEVSGVIDRSDVDRAAQRAALLRKAGLRVVPVVAGRGIASDALRLLSELGVAMLNDGIETGWDEALQRALAGRAAEAGMDASLS